MEKIYGPWVIKATESRYKDNFIELCVDQVIKPNKVEGTYATVQLKKGVVILAVNSKGQVYLTRQFRYAIGEESIELIAGGIDEGEEPLTAAKREAREELGIEAAEWTPMGIMHLETSIIKGPVYLFKATHLSTTDTDPDDTEDITGFKVSLQQAVDMVLQDKITHGPSCVLILKAAIDTVQP
jgi:8-oxo-dGTP pyrophosphatase MutT (NUDIX family)